MNKIFLSNGLYVGEIVVTRCKLYAYVDEGRALLDLSMNELLLIRDAHDTVMYKTLREYQPTNFNKLVLFTRISDNVEGYFYMLGNSILEHYITRPEHEGDKLLERCNKNE